MPQNHKKFTIQQRLRLMGVFLIGLVVATIILNFFAVGDSTRSLMNANSTASSTSLFEALLYLISAPVFCFALALFIDRLESKEG